MKGYCSRTPAQGALYCAHLGEAGVDEAVGHAVAAHPKGSPLLGDSASQPQHARLGCGVVDLPHIPMRACAAASACWAEAARKLHSEGEQPLCTQPPARLTASQGQQPWWSAGQDQQDTLRHCCSMVRNFMVSLPTGPCPRRAHFPIHQRAVSPGGLFVPVVEATLMMQRGWGPASVSDSCFPASLMWGAAAWATQPSAQALCVDPGEFRVRCHGRGADSCRNLPPPLILPHASASL